MFIVDHKAAGCSSSHTTHLRSVKDSMTVLQRQTLPAAWYPTESMPHLCQPDWCACICWDHVKGGM